LHSNKPRTKLLYVTPEQVATDGFKCNIMTSLPLLA
jgi:hypothetical protein